MCQLLTSLADIIDHIWLIFSSSKTNKSRILTNYFYVLAASTHLIKQISISIELVPPTSTNNYYARRLLGAGCRHNNGMTPVVYYVTPMVCTKPRQRYDQQTLGVVVPTCSNHIIIIDQRPAAAPAAPMIAQYQAKTNSPASLMAPSAHAQPNFVSQA